MKEIIFLDLKQIMFMHDELIVSFGGSPGIRDPRLLESAIAHPQAIIFGNFVYQDVCEMAAVYCYHIKNHPFVDGNKRTGLLVAITFLRLNGIRIDVDFESLYSLAIGIADSSISKQELIKFFKELCIS